MDPREQIIRENFDHLMQARAGMAGMTEKQLRAVQRAIKAIDVALDYSAEMYDLRLTDLERLQTAMYKLQHNFTSEPPAWQAQNFAEFDLAHKQESESQTLSVYRAVHEALDTQCEDTSAKILSTLLGELAETYKAETGQTIGEGLGWA